MGKVKSFISKHKKGLAIAGGAVGLAGLAYGAKKIIGRRGQMRSTSRRSTVSKLRTRVQKLTLKIKEKQLKRKLFKEELRV